MALANSVLLIKARKNMPDQTPADIASTYGWDTVFALHIRDVNRAIANAGSSPKSFTADDDVDNVHVKGTFGDWQLTTGGDGDLVRFAIPITSMTLQVPMSADYTGTATAIVEIRLKYLPRTADGDAPFSGTLHDLKVRTDAISNAFPAASVVMVTYGQTTPGFMGMAALPALLAAWLNANLGDFDHVFATVNLNRTADKGDFQWLQPTMTSYAYSDMGTPDNGVLGVLCMTGNRSPDGLVQQLSSKVVPDGGMAGFLISKERLLSQLILPTMPQVFAGSSVSNFAVATDGQSISSTSDSVAFTVTTTNDDGTQTSTPSNLQSLTITVAATELQMNVLTESDVSPGIKAYCQTQDFLGLQLVNRSDGEQTLSFYDVRNAIQNKWTTEDQGIQITEEVLGFVAIVAAVVLTVVTGGTAIAAAALVIGVVAGITAGTMMITTAALEMAKGGKAPAITSMILDTTAPIVWADSTDFKLTSAGLNDSLQLAGTWTFKGA
jgi:hypothetical protein